MQDVPALQTDSMVRGVSAVNLGHKHDSNVPRVMFAYWGRRGLTQFSYEVALAAMADPSLAATISVSRQNESFDRFRDFDQALFSIDTFSTNIGALTNAWRLPMMRKQLASRLRTDRTQVVVELMPHVWSSFLYPAIRSVGASYVSIIHDADSHPGDFRTQWAKGALDRAMNKADHIVTLSDTVATRLVETGRVPHDQLTTLFHPDLCYRTVNARHPPDASQPLKLLWLGRIMPYKGLSLFLDTVDKLRESGMQVEVGVFGEGALGQSAARLESMGAEVVNRWLGEDEIAAIMSRFQILVLSHTEASQSGIAATALGAGMPIVATPVGGLVEQISERQTGIIATETNAEALAAAIRRLALDPQLYQAICSKIALSKESRSMARGLARLFGRAFRDQRLMQAFGGRDMPTLRWRITSSVGCIRRNWSSCVAPSKQLMRPRAFLSVANLAHGACQHYEYPVVD
jgi:glycosyltransferase involved in cell wall biosynthesis